MKLKEFLESKGVWDKALSNMSTTIKEDIKPNDRIIELFLFSNTKEGFDFWMSLHKELEEIRNDKNN